MLTYGISQREKFEYLVHIPGRKIVYSDKSPLDFWTSLCRFVKFRLEI